MAATSRDAEQKPDYTGWIAGFAILAVILAVGAGVWVRFHG